VKLTSEGDLSRAEVQEVIRQLEDAVLEREVPWLERRLLSDCTEHNLDLAYPQASRSVASIVSRKSEPNPRRSYPKPERIDRRACGRSDDVEQGEVDPHRLLRGLPPLRE
jgi:hypothetical protein